MDGEVLRVRGVCGGLRMGRAPHGASFWGASIVPRLTLTQWELRRYPKKYVGW
jgi:hypothetical protein